MELPCGKKFCKIYKKILQNQYLFIIKGLSKKVEFLLFRQTLFNYDIYSVLSLKFLHQFNQQIVLFGCAYCDADAVLAFCH